jgi:hypothetical protein
MVVVDGRVRVDDASIMRLVRQVLAVVVAMSLALTPAMARASHMPVVKGAITITSSQIAMSQAAKPQAAKSQAAMPMDCPGHKLAHSKASPSKTPSHPKCPACPDGSCNAAACQASCAQAMAQVVIAPVKQPPSSNSYEAVPPAAHVVQSWQPQPPPPRA